MKPLRIVRARLAGGREVEYLQIDKLAVVQDGANTRLHYAFRKQSGTAAEYATYGAVLSERGGEVLALQADYLRFAVAQTAAKAENAAPPLRIAPTEVRRQNIDGVEYVEKTFITDADTRPAELTEADFEQDGFSARVAERDDLRRLFAVYFAQNLMQLTDDYDGERWFV